MNNILTFISINKNQFKNFEDFYNEVSKTQNYVVLRFYNRNYSENEFKCIINMSISLFLKYAQKYDIKIFNYVTVSNNILQTYSYKNSNIISEDICAITDDEWIYTKRHLYNPLILQWIDTIIINNLKAHDIIYYHPIELYYSLFKQDNYYKSFRQMIYKGLI